MSEEMSISDLLPLMAAALNDKAAADASNELATARAERDISRRVEVIRSRANGKDEDEDDDVVVYASGRFEDGKYARNTNLWSVPMEQNSNNIICRLADLRECHLCVGGGFPMASLDDTTSNESFFEGFIMGDNDMSQESTGDACSIRFCFNPQSTSTWLICLVHGWPREEWENAIQNDDHDSDWLNEFLVDTVAAQYPDAYVEFIEVAFVTRSIHGALKRLLLPKRKEEVRADRDKRDAVGRDPDAGALYDFIGRTMRERGNNANAAKFRTQLNMLFGFLSALGVNRQGENDELIMRAIEIHERLGVEGLQKYYDEFGPKDDPNEDGEEESEE